MTNPTRKAKTLRDRLRPLRVVEPAALATVAGGGETSSTSTSGTPEAGDDTVGDSTGTVGSGPLGYKLVYNRAS
jgi:hypothetical protein